MLISAVILLIICQIAVPVCLVLVVRRWIRDQVQISRDLVNAELLKLVNGEPCQTAAILNAAGRVIGSEAGRSAKASLMADLSHIKQATTSAASDQQLALIEDGAPGVGGVLAGMGPRTRGKLMSNPLIQLAIQAFMSGKLGGPGGSPAAGSPAAGSSGNGRETPSVRDRLRKGG